MSNISIKLTLSALIHGKKLFPDKNGKMQECLVIPIELNNLFKGEKGIYLDIVAWPYREKQEGKNTHYLRQDFPKEKREKFTEEEKKALPYFGNLIVWSENSNNNSNNEDPYLSAAIPQGTGDDDMPF
jgi:hypothetical protein